LLLEEALGLLRLVVLAVLAVVEVDLLHSHHHHLGKVAQQVGALSLSWKNRLKKLPQQVGALNLSWMMTGSGWMRKELVDRVMKGLVLDSR
jgi:hypothetical protein